MSFLRIIPVVVMSLMAIHAYAHKVNIFAYSEDRQLHVEGYFPDGKKAKNGKVQVFDTAGNLLAEGETDEQGQFIAPVQVEGQVKVALDAGLGHLSKATVFVTQVDTEEQGTQTGSERSSTANTISQDALKKTVHDAVQKAVIPLERRLASYENSTQFREIIGGLGYLLGFFGLVMFFHARQPNPQHNEPATRSAKPAEDENTSRQG